MDIPVRGLRCVANEVNRFHQKCIGCAEHAAHILHTADVLEHNDHLILLRFLKFINRFAVELIHAQFSHGAKVMVNGQW